MEIKPNINPLLESIVRDNESYDFPIDTIRMELLQMILNQFEFDYFLGECHKKLKMNYPTVFSTIFFNSLMLHLDGYDDVYKMSSDDYTNCILKLTEQLENTQVTRIEKNSPDGEMMSEII